MKKQPEPRNVLKKIQEDEKNEANNTSKDKTSPAQKRHIIKEIIKEQNKETMNAINHMTQAIVSRLELLVATQAKSNPARQKILTASPSKIITNPKNYTTAHEESIID